MGDFLNELSDVQRAAVCYNSGPVQVVAGAGSGKTRVLTYKIAHLIDEGMSPNRILALTFTNKAAKEMKSRIADLVGADNASKLWMGTFHSIFSRILRKEAERLGFSSDFTIYDTSDTQSLIKTIVKSRKLDDKVYSPKKIGSRISQMKNDLVTSEGYKIKNVYHDEDLKHKMPLFGDIYNEYSIKCKRNNAMDFDDLLLYTNILFRDYPEVLVKFQNIFQYILVDEYQDTNLAQFLIVQKLAAKSKKVCVVGDDAQSIYSFRGARIENILNFKQNYPDCKIFNLEQNYRSSQNIVKVANDLIHKNTKQLPKNVFSEKESKQPVRVMSSYSEVDESAAVAKQIMNLKIANGVKYSDIAILYRTNAQSIWFEKYLREHSIPYKIFGSTSFYEHKEILDVLAYFRLILNTKDEEALKRVIKYPSRGIGDTTIDKIIQTASSHDVSAWDVIVDPLSFDLNLNSRTLSLIGDFKNLINSFIGCKDEKDAYELAEMVVHNSGIWSKMHEDKSPENQGRIKNLEELLNGICMSCTSSLEQNGETFMLSDFMAEVALMTSQDGDNGDEDKVTLMTVHSSKGLEFKNVFIVGVEERLFPSDMNSANLDGVEEERRLFYVAITRAEERCFISYAKSRMKNGSMNSTNPSRFIRDIDPELLDFSLAKDFKNTYSQLGDKAKIEQNLQEFRNRVVPFAPKQREENKRYSFEPKQTLAQRNSKLVRVSQINNSSSRSFNNLDYSKIHVGSHIVHDSYNNGTVIALRDFDTPNAKAVVRFDNVGEKVLLLKFARIRIID